MQEYNIPSNMDQLFKEVYENGGSMSYSIIDYSEGMSMDNTQSMNFFLEQLGIQEEDIADDFGTQVVLWHNDYFLNLIIDSGGLGDFFSHSFDCYWEEVI